MAMEKNKPKYQMQVCDNFAALAGFSLCGPYPFERPPLPDVNKKRSRKSVPEYSRLLDMPINKENKLAIYHSIFSLT
jgi:hypothetical protein